ncbi:hypothetical protein TFLX_04899 [Thermoflexales bacterium]|nr:hypothetical protein TFLX_04899 [Thermoflexales bacterium]
MDQPDLLALYDAQLRIEIEYPNVRKEVFPQLVRFIKPAPGMNYVSYSRLDEADLDAVIQEQIAYFSTMDQPFSWHVYEHDTPPSLKEHLLAQGFAPDDDPDAVMVLEVQETSPALLNPAAIEIRRITQRDHLDDVVQIEAQVWGGDFGWLKQRLGDHLEVPNYLSVYVAYVDGQPACSSWIYFHPHSQFAGLFGGATLPDFRARGLYTAILAVRVQEAMQRGYRFLATGASPMSQPILAQNGFRLLTRAYAHEWQGSTEQ